VLAGFAAPQLVRERRGTQLEQWIADVQTTGPPELRGFSRNLHRDWVAVQAGLTVRWSSGPVEGNVNRVKLIKRQMFGSYVIGNIRVI
jgi:transposase